MYKEMQRRKTQVGDRVSQLSAEQNIQTAPKTPSATPNSVNRVSSCQL